jgi:hypothetical protein
LSHSTHGQPKGEGTISLNDSDRRNKFMIQSNRSVEVTNKGIMMARETKTTMAIHKKVELNSSREQQQYLPEHQPKKKME